MGIKDTFDKLRNGQKDTSDANMYEDTYQDDDYYSQFPGAEGDQTDGSADYGYDDTQSYGGGAPQYTGGDYGAAGGVSMSSGAALEMKVVKPNSFECVSQIADHLLGNRTVVLNLEETNKETARRLIDFLSGVAYSIDGDLKKVASNAYIITPSNVEVGDAKVASRATRQKPTAESSTSDGEMDF